MLSPDLARLMSAVSGTPGVTIGRALANYGLMRDGKLFAFIKDGALVLKLPAARIDILCETHNAVRFDRGQGKPLREWVVVPASHSAGWPDLVREACDFVGQ
ncbi:MAG: hypothetical protein ACXU8U_03700 [Asticcacaulis sp.]